MYKVNKKIIKKLTPIEVFDLSVLQGKNKILDRIMFFCQRKMVNFFHIWEGREK